MSAQDYPGPPLSPSRVGPDEPRCSRHPDEHRDMCRACLRIAAARWRELEVEIPKARAACAQGAQELATLREEARGACCPWCALGERWTGPYRAHWVRVVELVRLLQERRWPDDVELARKYYREFWP